MEQPEAYIPLIPPESGSRHRAEFDRRMAAGYEASAVYISIGAEIEEKQQLVDDVNAEPHELLDEYQTYIQPYVHHYLSSRIKDLTELTDPSLRLADLIPRAEVYKTVADQLILLPHLFNYPVDNSEARAIRRKLIDDAGLYSLYVPHLEESLNVVAKDAAPIVKQQMIGLANELTALALVNFDQSANMAGLPALPLDDMVNDEDLRVYHYRGKQAVKRPRQVKSNELMAQRLHSLETLIGGMAMGNNHASPIWRGIHSHRGPFVTAETIIGHVNNEGISEQHEAKLKSIAKQIIHAVRQDLPFSVQHQAGTDVA